jgi:aminoglycoside phosphotransferase (APT) family kinase protein
LRATAGRHPDLAARLQEIAAVTLAGRQALVHGDISPKNILCGPDGPVFLDAECAWYGDPAFDLAFCLNHLLLKGAWKPQWKAGYLVSFHRLAQAYLARIDWEPAPSLEARCAALLPALWLARVDGKSPVEYLVDEAIRARVRQAARHLLKVPVTRLSEVADFWSREDDT